MKRHDDLTGVNEQTRMTTDGMDMTFTYDDWGRIIGRRLGSGKRLEETVCPYADSATGVVQ